MKDVGSGRLDDHGAQRADIALVLVIAVLAFLRLRIQPGVGGAQDTLGRSLDRPGVRGAVVVFQKTRHGVLAGNVTYRAAADAIGQRNRYTLGAELRPIRHIDAVEILVGFLAALVRILPDGYFQFTRHVVSYLPTNT